MQCGIGAEEFWNMAYSDICDTILAHQERQKGQLQQQANLDYALASLIGVMVHEPKRMPRTPQKAYPGLFEVQEVSTDWHTIKANMKAFQTAHNTKLRKAGEKT